MKKILITGSTGFVGSYFINKYKVKYAIKTFSFLRDDIAALDCSDIEVVLHLSALVHQMGGASASEYERVNVSQTLELAQRAKLAGVKHFVFMSTIKVCGEESQDKYAENCACQPKDEYGKSKLRAEIALQQLESDSFKVSIVRSPIVYGYGVKANLKSLINLVRMVSVLPFRDVKNKRSMVYIGNLCHLIKAVLDQRKNGIFLAADDQSLSTSRLIELIAKSLNKKVYLLKIPFFATLLKWGKPSLYKRLYGSLQVDNSRTMQRLNLKNLYSAAEGIEFMVKGERG